MDFSALFETASDKIGSLGEKIRDFYEENRQLALIIAALGTVILLCLVLLIVYGATSRKKQAPVQPQPPLVLTEKLYTPPGPVLQNGYTVSRQSKNKWTDEEIEEWFTEPDEKEIEGLSKANDRIIMEIIGAAP